MTLQPCWSQAVMESITGRYGLGATQVLLMGESEIASILVRVLVKVEVSWS